MLSLTPQPSFSSTPTSSRSNPMVSGYISHTNTQPTTQITAYAPKVHVGVSNSIIGRKVSPTTKLQPQLVAVDMEDPRDRTLRGNNSDCCPVILMLAFWYDLCRTREPTWYRAHSSCVRRNVEDKRDQDGDSRQTGLRKGIIIFHSPCTGRSWQLDKVKSERAEQERNCHHRDSIKEYSTAPDPIDEIERRKCEDEVRASYAQ